jgi:hypothetical protein
MSTRPQQPIRIPREVLDGIEAVRESGRTNMLDRLAVQYIANELEYFATLIWLEDHRDDYARGLFHGFEPVVGAPGEAR